MLDLMELLGLDAPWQRYAACSWADRDRLGPIVGGGPTIAELDERTDAAQELCAHCPVRIQCAAAGDRKYEQGVWGGALRYEANGRYVAEALIPGAALSRYDRTVVHRRAPVCGGVR